VLGFNSDDPESIKQAILAVEEAINTRLRETAPKRGRYAAIWRA
jgi:hypothetical protein